MDISLFDYFLPKEQIAQHPISPRDSARLLCVEREQGYLEDDRVSDLSNLLKKGDVLVFNNSKVIPARLIGKKSTGGKAEVFLLTQKSGDTWETMLGGKRIHKSSKIFFPQKILATVIEKNTEGVGLVKFSLSGPKLQRAIKHIGKTPLPPYIHERARSSQYQTVYANEKKSGSVAAPTAGLHFTPRLLKRIKRAGVQLEFVTLHVGLGTFAPVKVQDITKHKMHPEFVDVDAATLSRIMAAKHQGRRIIAVGTTIVRVLESVLPKSKKEKISSVKKWINPFFYPGYTFHAVDGLLTNFHLPKSTLIMLVAAFAGRENILRAYQHAIRAGYRFYSFGDAMLIL